MLEVGGVLESLCVSEGRFEIAVFAPVGGGRGLELFLTEALLSGTGAFYSPHTRLGWRRIDTTPGCHPGLPWAAASQLYKDGL